MVKPSIKDVRTLITPGTSSISQTLNGKSVIRTTHDRTVPRPDPVTCQLPSQSMEEFFKAREFEITRL